MRIAGECVRFDVPAVGFTGMAELRHIYKYRGEWRFNGNFFRAWLKRFA